MLEAVRECLQDVYDVPELIAVHRSLESRTVRLAEVETVAPSPFADSLLFSYVGAFMYNDDAPLAERRAAALSLDTALLAQLLGRVDLRELLDPAVIAAVVWSPLGEAACAISISALAARLPVEGLAAMGAEDEDALSLDRADALVWALTHLMLAPKGRPRVRGM